MSQIGVLEPPTSVPNLGAVVGTNLLDRVMGYENPNLVARFRSKLGLSEEAATQLFKDTKRFLYLCGTNTKVLSPSEKVDAGWHEFLMFTQDYAEFCHLYFNHFIHHCPRRVGDPPSKGETGRATLALAQQVFGDTLSDNWLRPSAAGATSDPCDSCGCNAACNDD